MTSRMVLYVAHPVGGDVDANIERSKRWLTWLRRTFPDTTFIAPWLAAILSGADDHDPVQRERGLVDDCAVVERCDGIVLCGSRLSTGMQREMEHGMMHCQPPGVADYAKQFTVYNLICDPPGEPLPFIGEMPVTFAEWAALFEESAA